MGKKRGKRKAEPQRDHALDQGRAKRRRLGEGANIGQSSSISSIAPPNPARPTPVQRQPRRIAVPVSRKSHAIKSGTATAISQPKQRAGNRNPYSHQKQIAKEKGKEIPWVQGKPDFEMLCDIWPWKFKSRKYAMMALDLVEPEGAKSSPGYRLAKRGDSRADEPIESDWFHSGADDR